MENCDFSFTETNDTGWVCPVCRAVYAPFIVSCLRCIGNGNRWPPYPRNPAPGLPLPYEAPVEPWAPWYPPQVICGTAPNVTF